MSDATITLQYLVAVHLLYHAYKLQHSVGVATMHE